MTGSREQPGAAPKVSVIIPAYGMPHYLNQAIESVSRQTFTDYELLVVDDGSDDECVARYELPKTARLIRHESNRGAGAARNTGIRAGKGDYVALLDHDDVWLPGKLEAQVAILEANPDASLAYCRCILVDDELNPKSDTRWTEKSPSADPLRQFLDGCFIRSCSAVMVRREAFHEVGMFDESLTGTDDGDFYMRLALHHGFVYDPEPLALYRMHAGQFTRSLAKIGRSRVRMFANVLPEIKRNRPDLVWPARRRLSTCHLLCAHALLHYERAPLAAAKTLLAGLVAWPANATIYGRLAWMPFAALRYVVKSSRDPRRTRP